MSVKIGKFWPVPTTTVGIYRPEQHARQPHGTALACKLNTRRDLRPGLDWFLLGNLPTPRLSSRATLGTPTPCPAFSLSLSLSHSLSASLAPLTHVPLIVLLPLLSPYHASFLFLSPSILFLTIPRSNCLTPTPSRTTERPPVSSVYTLALVFTLPQYFSLSFLSFSPRFFFLLPRCSFLSPSVLRSHFFPTPRLRCTLSKDFPDLVPVSRPVLSEIFRR